MQEVVILKVPKPKALVCVVVLPLGDLVEAEWVGADEAVGTLSTAAQNARLAIRLGCEFGYSAAPIVVVSSCALEHRDGEDKHEEDPGQEQPDDLQALVSVYCPQVLQRKADVNDE